MKKTTKGLSGKQNKYDGIRELIIENYPKDGDPEKYPNYDIIEAVITKGRVSAKLGKVRRKVAVAELFLLFKLFAKISGEMVRQ